MRQNTIMELILSQDIETQNQLIEALEKAGIKSTQATVSRDIKELHITTPPLAAKFQQGVCQGWLEFPPYRFHFRIHGCLLYTSRCV